MCGSEKEKYLGKYFDLIVPKKKKKKNFNGKDFSSLFMLSN